MDDRKKTCLKGREQIKLLSEWTGKTLSREPLSAETVIEACDRVSRKIDERYLPLLLKINLGCQEKSLKQLKEAKTMLSRTWLEEKMIRELGCFATDPIRVTKTMDSMGQEIRVKERRMPLGVLFHISAGNMEGLPADSVIEGLLTGNVNILKTAEGDQGLSLMLLDQLIEEEPALADYISVFKLPSFDVQGMEEIGNVADGIVVWGGDEAVKAVRALARPNTKIIEWGHKISFCYVTDTAWKAGRESAVQEQKLRKNLERLAEHMLDTNQLFCDSCQGIFLDTESKKELVEFGRYFLEILETCKCGKEKIGANGIAESPGLGIEIRARVSYRLRCMELERGKRVLRGRGCSVTLYGDSCLEPSLMFGNCWARPLPQDKIIKALRPYKNYLHTAGLISGEQEMEEAANKLFRSGVVRVKSPEHLGTHWAGEPHDGEYSMLRYIRVITMI